MGIYKPYGHYGYLSMYEASAPRIRGRFHDLFWLTHRASVVVFAHYYQSMDMGYWIFISDRREGAGGEIWGAIQCIPSTGTYVFPKPALRSQGSL